MKWSYVVLFGAPDGGIVRQTAILIDKIGQKNRSTVQIQIDEHLRDKIVLSGEDGDLELATYGG